jgi:hypothetical protein
VVEISTFNRIDLKPADTELNVTLSKGGIHRSAQINLDVVPPLSVDEKAELIERGYMEDSDEASTDFEGCSTINLDRSDEIEQKHEDAAFAIAETLASMREVEAARVDVMHTYMFGDFRDFVKKSVLLVRQ